MNPLADSTYRRLFSAQVIALAGSGLSTVALALLAYELAADHAGRVLGTALMLKMLAYVSIAPLAGAFAHRLPRKSMLVSLDVLRAACVFAIPWVSEIWQIYTLIVLLSACSAAFTPVFQATIPLVLSDDARYTRALSLSRLAYDLENLFSPALAAAALLFMSYHQLFTLNAAAFLISALLIVSVHRPLAAGGAAEQEGWANLLFGLRAYLGTPRLQGLLALSLAVAAAGSMAIIYTVVHVRTVLGGSEFDTALMLCAFGAGSMAAALSLPRLLDRFADRPFMLSGGALMAAGLGALALLDATMGVSLLLWFLLGTGSALVQTPCGRLLKRSASALNQPALFAAHFALSHACWLALYPAVGFLSSAVQPAALFSLLALAAGLATLLAARRWPRGQDTAMTHTHAALQHEHNHVHDAHHQHSHEGWEGPEPHRHPHAHTPVTHSHDYQIDLHHPVWPSTRVQ